MIHLVIFYRGYLGFQPQDRTVLHNKIVVSGDTHIPDITRYIHNKRLLIDMCQFNPNYAFFMDYPAAEVEIASPDQVWQWLVWDDRNGLRVDILTKSHKDGRDRPKAGERQSRALRLRKGRFHIIGSPELSSPDYDRLFGVLKAQATLQQVDSFIQEFVIGSGRPMVWTPIHEVRELITNDSWEFRYKDLLEDEPPTPVVETPVKPKPRRRRKKTPDPNTPFL